MKGSLNNCNKIKSSVQKLEGQKTGKLLLIKRLQDDKIEEKMLEVVQLSN